MIRSAVNSEEVYQVKTLIESISTEKFKMNILDLPKFSQVLEDPNFVKSIAWNSFVLVMINFPGKKLSDNQVEPLEGMLSYMLMWVILKKSEEKGLDLGQWKNVIRGSLTHI